MAISIKNPVDQLGRWLEELCQYSITIQHRPGVRHSNADGLSRIPETLPECDYYKSGREVSSLPCGGCPYCTRLNDQCGRFEEEIDYVVPLTVRQLNPPDQCDGTVGGGHIDSNYMARYSSQELRDSQLRDSELQPVITWLNGEPRQETTSNSRERAPACYGTVTISSTCRMESCTTAGRRRLVLPHLS